MHGGQQQWSCSVCTFKQSASANRCGMCSNANPFMVGSSQSASYFQPQRAPPKPKPIVKKELEYQAKPKPNGEYGKIIYQTDRISKQQVLDTYAIYLLNKDMSTSSWPLYVFGENDIDKHRPKGGARDMIGGLANVLGDYDTSISFGITSTYYKDKYVNNDFNAFKKIIDNEFDQLLKYIKAGHDIVVPSPNLQDLHGYYEKSYWKTVNNQKTQVIFHNIGTGLAQIPFIYIEYIQTKFAILKEIGEKNSENINGINKEKNNDDKKQTDAKDENNNDDKKQTDAKDENNDKDKDKKPPVMSDNNQNKKDENDMEIDMEIDKDTNDNNKQKNENESVDADAELAKAIQLSMQQPK